MAHVAPASEGLPLRSVVLGSSAEVQIPRGAANSAAVLRITLGLLYLWAFVSQGFGLLYANNDGKTPTSYGWHFSYNSSAGWISSGFKHSPTAAYIGGTHGPLAFIVQKLPTGLDDFGWMFALIGLGIALTLGIFMRIAGWGGFALNILIWFSGFPPSNNPVIDGTHTVYAVLLLLLMFLHAGHRWGFGDWWSRHTPSLLH
jgi:thiosulfate dehydrogenase (quinone) large subunit